MIRALAFGLALAAGGAAQAQTTCRQALALGLDVSASVNATEYRLQLDGLAAALEHPDVVSALLVPSAPPVRLMVYQWSGTSDQMLVIGWTDIVDDRALNWFTDRLRTTIRRPANPATALGTAMLRGAEYLQGQGLCWTRTLDLSGDGKSNTGPRPRDVAGDPVFNAIIVNALVIGSDGMDGGVVPDSVQELESYFRRYVIRGPGAFVETAIGFQDYEQAMVRKLLRELQGLNVSQASTGVPDR